MAYFPEWFQIQDLPVKCLPYALCLYLQWYWYFMWSFSNKEYPFFEAVNNSVSMSKNLC